MKRSEVTVLLAKVAAYDRRTVGGADIEAWAEVMSKNDIPLPDALVAVGDHFGSSHDWLMPIHIIERVKSIRRERLQHAGTPPIPGDLTRAQELDWSKLWCSYVKDGETRNEAEQHAYRTMSIPLSELPVNLARVRQIEALAQSKSVPRATA